MKKTLLLLILLIGTTPLLELHAQQLKVVSFNIRNNSTPKADGKNAWAIRRQAVFNMMTKENPDIIGIQEALLDQLNYIDKKFINKYRRYGTGREVSSSRGEHTVIYYNYSKLELISSSSITQWLNPYPQRPFKGWDATELHIMVVAKFREKETDKEFYYINTQLDRDGAVSRSESLKLIAKYILENIPAGTTVIVGGDMNMEPYTDDFDPITDMGLKEARRIALKTDYRNTYNAFGNEKESMIDHFFVRYADVLKFKTLKKNFGVSYISDHYPIEMIINLQ